MVEKEIVLTVKFPAGITPSVKGNEVTLKGNKGEQTRDFKSHRIKLEQKDNTIIIIGEPANKATRAILNTIVAHLKNMALGLKYGYKYTMEISYSHFPMTAEIKGKEVIVKNFLGEKFPRRANIVGESKVNVKGQNVIITGHKLEEVSQTSANIELCARVKKKDIRRFSDGIYLTSKGTDEEREDEFKVITVRGRE